MVVLCACISPGRALGVLGVWDAASPEGVSAHQLLFLPDHLHHNLVCIPEILTEQFKGGKVYFGSWFHRVFDIVTVKKAGRSSGGAGHILPAHPEGQEAVIDNGAGSEPCPRTSPQ